MFSMPKNLVGGGTPYEGANPITPGDSNIVIPAKTLIKDLLTILAVPTEVKTVTPSASQKIVTPSAGKYLNKVTVSGDADLIGRNIRKGVNLFGVVGTLLEGIDPSKFGCTKYAIEKFTFSSDTTYKNTVNHSLGEIPKFVFIIGPEEYPSKQGPIRVWCILSRGQHFISYGGYVSGYSKFTDADVYNPNIDVYLKVTDSTINVNNDSSQSYYAGVEYTLITMA